MATTAQVLANRQNAQSSTGPTTAAGKAVSSTNATKSGLFAKRDFVRPEERPLWEQLRAELLAQFQPVGALEETFANEIITANWRLRRCAAVEAELQLDPATESDTQGAEFINPIYQSIARARSQATRSLKAAIAALRELQTERQLRAESYPETDLSPLGLGSVNNVIKALLLREGNEGRAMHNLVRRSQLRTELFLEKARRRFQNENAKRTRSTAQQASSTTIDFGNSPE